MANVEAPFLVAEASMLKYCSTLSTSSPLRRGEGGRGRGREGERERERERDLKYKMYSDE